MELIHPDAIKAWRISGLFKSFIFWFIPILYYLWYPDWNVPFELIYILIFLTLTYSFLSATLIPQIRWRRWKYAVRMEEIELRHGIFIITRTLIPIYRVQHVDTRQGPLYSWFNLASVTISTAATTHEIPALQMEVADEVRNKISRLAREVRPDVTI